MWIARVVVVVAAAASIAAPCSDPDPGAPVWPTWGGDLHNTHHARGETRISPATVASLRPRWVVKTAGPVSAIPTLSETRAYVFDWGIPGVGFSSLYAIDRDTGAVVAREPITRYSGNLLHNVARTSPAIAGDMLVFGDLRNQPSSLLAIPGAHGAALYAIDRRTGTLLWKTILDPHPLAIVTASPTIYEGRAYVGVSSYEEPAAKLGYDCCSFRGSVVAVDLGTGSIAWQTYTAPGGGFTGNAVWGSAPAIDEVRRQVYVATGNNYTMGEGPDVPDNYASSVLALDLDTGAIRWARKLENFGPWTFACAPYLAPWIPTNVGNCPDFESEDWDFGQAPMLLTVAEGAPRDLVVVGQKSGVLWAFDPDTGATVWSQPVGPGGVLGGMEFGSASDGERVYVGITNVEGHPWTAVAGPLAGTTHRGGLFAAVDAATGAILWQTPDPSSALPRTGLLAHPVWGAGLGPGFFAWVKGPLTVANGVVFGGSMDPLGHMYALDAATGAILWSFPSGGSVMSAPSIDDGVLYWGSGYLTGFPNDKLYAFEIP